MVALAILCGCDYGVGACGTAITTALSFLHTVPDDQVIDRLLRWVSDPEHYEEKARWAAAPGRCDRCGHVGRTHVKKGCPVCATHHGCEDRGHKAKVSEVKRELSLRNRALSSGMPFPEPKVMKEFLDGTTEDVDLDALKIPVPSLIQFVKIMTHKLDWSERYCVEKFLPLLTKWHLQDYVPCRTIKPIAIKKKRNPRGIPSYEVVWGDIDGQYEALIPDDQFGEEDDTKAPWTTTERQDLMRRFHLELVESYEESIKKPPKVKKPRGRKKKDNKDDGNEENKEVAKPKRKYVKKAKTNKDSALQTLNDSLRNLSISSKAQHLNSSKSLNVSVSVNRLKRKLKNPKTKPKNTIESYLVRKKIRLSKSVQSFNKSLKNLSIINSENNYCFDNDVVDVMFDNDKENIESNNILDAFNDSVEDSRESDLSDILDQIVSKAPATKTAKVDNNLVKLIFNKNMTSKKNNNSNIAKNTPASGRSNSLLRKSLNHKNISIRKSILKNNCSTPNSSPMRKSFVHGSADNLFDSLLKKNTSNFFDKLTEDRDAFEMSVEDLQGNSIIILD